MACSAEIARQNGKKGGRRTGSKNKSTLERQAVLDAFNQRVMAKADVLFNAQLSLAIGSSQVFRVDESEDSKGKVKREHVLVTDADEIKALLDEHDGANGVVEGAYYYFSTVLPDNKAIEALMNRAFGRAKETIESTETVVMLSSEERAARAAELLERGRARLRLLKPTGTNGNGSNHP